MQGGVRDAGGVAELGEAVAKDLGNQPLLMGLVGAEQPRTKRLAGSCRPSPFHLLPEVGGGAPDCQGAGTSGLGRGELGGGDGAFDAQDAASQVGQS